MTNQEATANIVNSQPPPDDRSAWHLSFARALGRAARWATDEFDVATRSTLRAVDAGRGAVKLLGQRMDPNRGVLQEKVKRLATVIERHSPSGYEALEKDQRFWELVEEINGVGPPIADAPKRKSKPTKQAAASGEPVVVDEQPETAEAAGEAKSAGEAEAAPAESEAEAGGEKPATKKAGKEAAKAEGDES
jgi:hypothetical protein